MSLQKDKNVSQTKFQPPKKILAQKFEIFKKD